MLNIDSCMAKIVHADYYVGKLLKLHQLPPWQLLVTHMGNVSHCRLGRSLSLCSTSREYPVFGKEITVLFKETKYTTLYFPYHL